MLRYCGSITARGIRKDAPIWRVSNGSTCNNGALVDAELHKFCMRGLYSINVLETNLQSSSLYKHG